MVTIFSSELAYIPRNHRTMTAVKNKTIQSNNGPPFENKNYQDKEDNET